MTVSTVIAQVQVGDLVAGKYRVDRVIGEGGMGLVVGATHEQLDQRVALKFLQPAVASRPDIVQRFMREARAAVKIQSEHVARVFDVGTHGVAPFMVMEYLEGGDIAQVLATRGPLSPREAVGYVLQACTAIAEAHALGIVHRDLKPANLFLANRASGKPIIKVLDFGISKTKTGENEAAITNASAIMGSPSYMSPEQMVASASVDARTDIWALGVVLYEMLTVRLPFVADSMPELVGVILQGTFAPLSTLRADVPPALQAVVDKCLLKAREERFQNVAELARALLPFAPPHSEALIERIESVLGLSEAVASVGGPTALSSSVPAVSPTFAPTTAPPAKPRSPLVVIGPLALVLAVGALIGVVVMRSHLQQAPNLVVSTSSPPSAMITATIDPTPTASETHSSAPVFAESATPQSTAYVRPHASAHASATPATSSSAAPGCHVVTTFDNTGNKHFKLECPP